MRKLRDVRILSATAGGRKAVVVAKRYDLVAMDTQLSIADRGR